MKRKRRILLLVVGAILVSLVIAFVMYVSDYYRADQVAHEALEASTDVIVEKTDFGWRFDGPATDVALVFYPGGKVEAAAYAPLLHQIAQEGVDTCLVEMPFNLAVFNVGAASKVIGSYDYERWYVGGHSLGGVMAASYASSNSESVDGVVLCAAYPAAEIGDDLPEVVVYGTRDEILDAEDLEASRSLWSEQVVEKAIEGGNHAQFGSYGVQTGDGIATISPEKQWCEAADVIVDAIALC